MSVQQGEQGAGAGRRMARGLGDILGLIRASSGNPRHAHETINSCRGEGEEILKLVGGVVCLETEFRSGRIAHRS